MFVGHYAAAMAAKAIEPRAPMWTLAAALFAVVALGAVGATAWYGLPDWMPFARPTFAEEQPGLKLDFPAKQQDRRQCQGNQHQSL